LTAGPDTNVIALKSAIHASFNECFCRRKRVEIVIRAARIAIVNSGISTPVRLILIATLPLVDLYEQSREDHRTCD
jgi:hypothetical protein